MHELKTKLRRRARPASPPRERRECSRRASREPFTTQAERADCRPRARASDRTEAALPPHDKRLAYNSHYEPYNTQPYNWVFGHDKRLWPLCGLEITSSVLRHP